MSDWPRTDALRQYFLTRVAEVSDRDIRVEILRGYGSPQVAGAEFWIYSGM